MNRDIRIFANRVKSSALLMLIAINVAVWLALRIDALVEFVASGKGGPGMLYYLVAMPSSPADYPASLYTAVTYMFAQYGLWHLLCNMLVLYWFGDRFLDISTDRQLVILYIYGGLAGALFYMVGYNVFFHHTIGLMVGASASVLAILTAAAALMPDCPIPLLFIGEVKLKWIAIVAAVIVLLNLSGDNFGGELAHLGGIAMGLTYALLRKGGIDITKPVAKLLDLFKRRPAQRQPKAKRWDGSNGASAPKTQRSATESAELDRLLDKIKMSGYASLSDAERKRLFELSSKV